MYKILLALILLTTANAISLGGYYKFKSDSKLICRNDHYGTFLIRKRVSGSFEELKFNPFIISNRAALIKLKKEYSKLKSIKASSKLIRAKKLAITKLEAINSEVAKCRSGKVKWVEKINFSQICTLIGGSALKTPNGIVTGERCLEGNSPIARIYLPGPESTSICSGTLVTPNTVVTAAHCVKGVSELIVIINRKVRTVVSAVFNPSYDENSFDFERHDLGLIFLSEAVSDVMPAKIYTGDSFTKSEKGIVGGYGDDRAGSKDNILRGGYIFLDSVTSDVIYSKFTGLESNICNGDSGGPLYLFREGKWQIAAVSSAGSKGCLAPAISGFARLAGSNLDFLQANGVF